MAKFNSSKKNHSNKDDLTNLNNLSSINTQTNFNESHFNDAMINRLTNMITNRIISIIDVNYLLYIKNLKLSFQPVLNKKPPLPFNRISLGPVGQSEDITNFFNTMASRITLGNPSNFDDKINKSDFLINLKGLF